MSDELYPDEQGTIYLDMDGVLVDFVGSALELYGVPRDLRVQCTHWDSIPKVISRYYGKDGTVNDEQFWAAVTKEGAKFWSDIKWLPWGRDLLALCGQRAPVVLMTTPTGSPSAAGKMDWIQKHLPKGARFAITNCKHHMSHQRAILIDDNDGNVCKFREFGGDAFLVPAPWNEKGHVPHSVTLLKEVNDFLDEKWGPL